MPFTRYHKSQLSDRDLWAFYDAMKGAGRLESLFYNVPEISREKFVAYIRRGDVEMWLCIYSQGGKAAIVGSHIITGMQGKTADMHFVTLPAPWLRTPERVPLPVAMCRHTMAETLYAADKDKRYVFDTLYGVTPIIFKAACKVATECGGVPVALLPDRCWMQAKGENVGGYLTVFTRDTVRPEWRAY